MAAIPTHARVNAYDAFGVERFDLTAEHARLLPHLNIRWNGDDIWGAPAVDGKRPYGSSSGEPAYHVYSALGGSEFNYDAGGELPEAELERCRRLHRDMEKVLQILVATGRAEPGLYEMARYHTGSWRRVTDGQG